MVATKSIKLAIEDVFDLPGEPAEAGTAFLGQVRQSATGGSSLVMDIQEAGFGDMTRVSSLLFANGEKTYSPLAQSLLDGTADIGVGLDDGAWHRMAAAQHGLYCLRLFAPDWLGQGCVAIAPSVSGIAFLAKDAEALKYFLEKLLGDQEVSQDTHPRLLDLSSQIGQDESDVFVQAVASIGAEEDPETASWLLERFRGVELSHWVLASKEGYGIHSQWLGPELGKLPEEIRTWLMAGLRWSPDNVKAAYAKQSEIVCAIRELYEQYDGFVMPLFASDEDTIVPRPRLTLPADIAHQTSYIIPLGEGRALQVYLNNLGDLMRL